MNLKKTLSIFSLLIGLSFPAWTQNRHLGFLMEEGRDKVTIPFETLSNLIVIEVTLNDQLPLKFVLDTGVKTPILTDKYMSDIVRVSYHREIEIFSAGAQGIVSAHVANDVTISIPGIRAEYQDIFVLKDDLLGLTEVLGERVHGLIGYDFFKDFIVSVDYAEEEITFYRKDAYRPSVWAAEVPMQLVDAKPYIVSSLLLPDGTAQEAKLLLDTGASHALWLDPPADTTRSILPNAVFPSPVGRTLSGEIEGNLGRIPAVYFGNTEFTDVITSFPNRSTHAEVVDNTGRAGTIGAEIFRRFKMTFDYSREVVYLERNKYHREPFQFNMSGIHVIRNLQTSLPSYIINQVDINSPAEAVGIQQGDEIVRLNGIDRKEISLNQINYMLKSREGRRVRMVILRNGVMMKKEFRLKSLI